MIGGGKSEPILDECCEPEVVNFDRRPRNSMTSVIVENFSSLAVGASSFRDSRNRSSPGI